MDDNEAKSNETSESNNDRIKGASNWQNSIINSKDKEFLIQLDENDAKLNETVESNDGRNMEASDSENSFTKVNKSNETIQSNDDDDDDQKTKEKLNQRREARRRKILDNAKNRLVRLSGRTATTNTSTPSSCNEHQSVKYDNINGQRYIANESGEFSDPEIEPDVKPFLNRETNNVEELDREFNGMRDLLNIFAAPPPPPSVQRHIVFRARLHLVLSALISCIFTLFWKPYGFSIFIAPGLCVITDLLFFSDPKPLNPILITILMMLDNRILTFVQKYIHLIGIVRSVVADLCVFIFSYCTFLYLILLCTNNRFDDIIVLK